MAVVVPVDASAPGDVYIYVFVFDVVGLDLGTGGIVGVHGVLFLFAIRGGGCSVE